MAPFQWKNKYCNLLSLPQIVKTNTFLYHHDNKHIWVSNCIPIRGQNEHAEVKHPNMKGVNLEEFLWEVSEYFVSYRNEIYTKIKNIKTYIFAKNNCKTLFKLKFYYLNKKRILWNAFQHHKFS